MGYGGGGGDNKWPKPFTMEIANNDLRRHATIALKPDHSRFNKPKKKTKNHRIDAIILKKTDIFSVLYRGETYSS